MDYFKVSKLWEEGQDLRILEFSNFDMKGYFPARLINMMMASAGSKQLADLYKQARETEAAMLARGESLRD